MPLTVMDIDQRTSTMSLVAPHVEGKKDIDNATWLNDPTKVDEVRSLRDLALGNCRLLYGSERFRFYDIVTCSDELGASFCAVLTCNVNAETRLLRKAISTDAVSAVRILVDRLQKDSGLLLTKYNVGSTFEGQQGFTNEDSETWELDQSKRDIRSNGPVDIVRTTHFKFNGKRAGDCWAPVDAPRGPRGDRNGYKRARNSDDQLQEEDIKIDEYY